MLSCICSGLARGCIYEHRRSSSCRSGPTIEDSCAHTQTCTRAHRQISNIARDRRGEGGWARLRQASNSSRSVDLRQNLWKHRQSVFPMIAPPAHCKRRAAGLVKIRNVHLGSFFFRFVLHLYILMLRLCVCTLSIAQCSVSNGHSSSCFSHEKTVQFVAFLFTQCFESFCAKSIQNHHSPVVVFFLGFFAPSTRHQGCILCFSNAQ